MTYKRLLELAYNEALRIWAQEWDYLKKNPNNILTQMKEHAAAEELEGIRKALIAEEEAMRCRA